MKVHFLGIGGSGASAAASIAQAQGFEVSGCDLEPNNEFTKNLGLGTLDKGHSPKHLKNVDILAITPAITSLDANNPELLEAKKIGLPVLTWQQFVGEYLTKDKFVIAICGTHGKTTTTAMIAQVLEDANLDPTVLLGAIHPKWKANYRIGKSKYFVVEADEFNDNFLAYHPDITVVINIEMDHPEYFKDLNAYLDSFEKFFLQTKQTIVANLLDSNVAEIVKDVMKESSVSAIDYSKNQLDLELKIPGDFNKLNALAALEVGLLLAINPQTIRKSLENYTGVGRRFEFIGTYNGAQIYSDFGHHPTEIKVTMEAAREEFPNSRILLIYQPHMFSRTKTLFNDFVKVFQNLPVDTTAILDIYPSREIDTGLVTSKELVKVINKENITYFTWEDLKLGLKYDTTNEDVLFFMGAGDIDKMARELIKERH